MVNEQLRKIFHHDEEAEREKNATIYMKQFENIMAQSEINEEKSFQFNVNSEYKAGDDGKAKRPSKMLFRNTPESNSKNAAK